MSHAQLLKKEIEQGVQGGFVPYYFKYCGYKSNFGACKVLARANAIHTLFTLPIPHIYRNDLIVGSIYPLWREVDAKESGQALRIEQSFGDRAFPNNFDHYSPNYSKFVRNGIPGLLQEIANSKEKHTDTESADYLAAMEKTVLAIRAMIVNYAERAKELQTDISYSAERLEQIHLNCLFIADNAPETFEQALQLVWFSHICFNYECRYAMALGRMDQYLYSFYVRDLEKGVLDAARATELLENVFIKIYESHVFKGWDDVVNICIGGTDTNDNCEVNDLSYCILYAVKNCKIPGPNLSARIAENCPDHFLDECLKVIGTGIGYPALMNDAVNIAALSKFGYDKKDIYDYSMVGCIENFITGKQPPWTDGRFDAPRFFEFLFNRGKGIYCKSFGIDTGDVSQIRSMDDFMSKFEEQLRFGVSEYYSLYHNENARYNPKEYVQPFLSCFCDDCIGRAKDICDGGSLYPSVHGVALMGVGTVCDSLAAIEKTVYIDHTATLSEIREAIIHNFEGYESLHKSLLSAPKYGNNNSLADRYAVWFVDFFAREFGKYRTYDGGKLYIGMAANINNVHAGKEISATPDGRLQGEPLSDAASPSYGKDVFGATVSINSITKPDYTKVACGTVINQKFSPSVFEDGKREKLLALIKVYFHKGGQEMQINATSREVLLDAMEHPENYGNLVVRVSGFSALYITLEKGVQLDILHRTQQV